MRTAVRAACLLCCFITLTVSSFAVTYYTYVNGGSSGFWNNAGTWTTDPSGMSLTGSAVPGNGDVVYILNGYTVNLNANVTTTNLSINILNGGVLNLSTYTFGTLNALGGSGTLRIGSGYFPSVVTNTFSLNAASGATVEFTNFTGTLPGSINYPNLLFSNSTATNHTISIPNTAGYNLLVSGNLTTQATGSGTLTVLLGTQATNKINLTVQGNVTIGAGTTFGVGTFNANHTITLYGNLTNNGTVDLSNSGQYTAANNGSATLTFTGTTNNVMTCNGTTDLYTLTVDKGSGSTYILSVTSTNSANLKFFSNGQLIDVVNGTLRLGANIDIPRVYGTGTANYNLGSSTASPMLWIDGADFNTNSNALVVYGKFRITAGTFTCVGREGTVIREEGQYLIEGGTFTTEKFRPSNTDSGHRGSFTMTGGTFNVVGTASNNNYARFSIPYAEQVFIMSGGTINVHNPQAGGGGNNGGIHIGCKESNYNVTGGSINAILSGSAAFFNVSSTAPFWNFTISRTGGTPTTVRLAAIGGVGENSAQPLRVLNDFTIEGTNSPVFNANGQDVSVGGNFILNSGGTYNPNGNTTIFNGTGDQTFTNSGTITSGLYNLTMDKPSGALLISGTNASLTITQTLHLENGVFNDGGKTIIALGSIYNAAVHTGTGSIRLQGTSTQTISGDGTGVFGNMWLNNSSNPGATATADIAISGTLTLAGGTSYFDINENLLALTSTSASAVTTSGSSFGASKMVRTSGYQSDRGVRKTFGNTTAFTFPVGVGTIYTPATIQLTAAPTTYGTITVRPVNARHPLVAAGNTSNLMWYWKITSSGFTGVGANGVSHTFRYQEAQVVPANSDVNYVPARYHPTSWTVINNTNAVDQGTNTISFTNVGYIDGEFTAGVPAAFGIVRIFYSKRSGDWSDTSPGTTPWSNVSHTGPDATSAPTVGDHVYIGDGSTHNHTITITANNQAAGGLEINSGSTLDLGVTTGHNFGTLHNTQVGGSGRLRISSSGPVAQFPGGDFGNFIRESGGTVEYYTTGNQSFVIPKTSAAPTNLPLKSYRHLIVAPGAGRTITLPDENLYVYGNVTVDGNASGLVLLNSTASRTLTVAGNLTIASGVLRFENVTPQTVEVLGDLTVNSAGQFTLSTSGTVVTNELILHGSMVNNGVFDMAVMGGHICNTTFKGNANATVTGTGPNTEFNVLTVDKGSSIAPILDVNLNSFSLAGTPSPLVLVSGTFRLSSAQSVTIASNTDFNIPSQARLSANGGTFHITGPTGTDLLLAGTLEVLNGTVNVGTSSNDNSIEYAATGQPTISISGGTLNVRSQIRRSAASSQGSLVYNQSGGVVNAGISTAPTTTRGVFEILNPGSSFTMSGGTLSIGQPSNGNAIADLYLQPAAYAVTGGTVQIGTGALSRTVDVNSAIPLYNFEVTGSGNTTRLEANGLTLLGSLTIQASDVFNAAGYNVSIAGNFTNLNTNNGTGTAIGGYQAGSATQTTTLNGSANHQVFTGTAGNLTNFANLIVNNTFAGGAVNVQPNSNIRVNGMLTLSNGTLAGSTNTITVIGNVSNSAVHTSSGTGSITLAGSSTQIITGNGNGKFGNLTLNNASGATFGANQEVTGTLTFVNGSLNIGAYGLNLSSTSLSSIAGYSASRYIITGGNISDVGVTKAFASSVTAGVFEFPIGVSGKYTPAHYTITTGASGGTIRIKPVNSKHPNATGSGTAFIRYYWSVTNNGVDITSLTHTYTYVAADENGDPTDYRDARFQGGAWTIGVTAGNPNSTTRVIVFTNVNLTGDYTAGEQTAFLNPQTYTSIASGDWESDAVWDVDPPGNGLGPPPGSFVVISEGHTVTVTTSTRRTATLEVRGRLHLGTTTGHEFGTVSSGGTGDKTIQIQSSTFPSGNFSPFVAAGGGTIEYNGAVTLPTQTTYNNLTFTGAGTKTLPNVDLVLNGTLTIVQGTVTNAVNNRNIELAGSGQHFVNNGTFHMGTGEITIGGNLTNSGASAVFNAGNGDDGLHILGSLSNISGATFNAGTDSVGVRGSLLNEGTFNAGAGMMRIRNNLTNVSGAFNGGAGAVTIRGSLTNNAAFTAGTGTMTVTATFTNTGAGATYASGSGALVVSGNFVNGPSATFDAGSGSVMLSGNWSNSGTFNSGTGSVTFESNGVQTLTGTTAFYRLNRSNGGSLQLNSDITVSDQLVFSSGKIVTGSNTVELTNTASQPVSGYGNTAFIDGRVSIAYPNTAGASRVFPVGKGNVYRPVVIQQTAASTSPVVRVEMINTPPTGTYPVEVGVLSEARYYAIDLVSGTMNAPTVELNFNTNSTADENVLFAGNAHIMRATNSTGPWTDEGGSGVFSPAAPTGYATSGVTSIANQTFFTLGYQNVILPVELSAFSGYLENGVVELFWTTLSEENNDYFTIERSGVELHFDSIGFVSGAGNSNVKLHYRYSDLNPLDGVSYYRLKQTDFDGQVIYSRTITIKSHFEEPVLSVYPNPARSGEPVYVRLDYSKEKDVMLSVADMSGRTLFSGVVDLSSTVELNDIVRANLSPGTYVLRFMLRGALFTQKIIVY
ncbi:MAG: T9SS type A sorting domain-containing protein [Cyclobacteriaceae bacterium]|nr:T9SS type A sorting domain-containing protein [Cyclobacteriaceae bacterium]